MEKIEKKKSQTSTPTPWILLKCQGNCLPTNSLFKMSLFLTITHMFLYKKDNHISPPISCLLSLYHLQHPPLPDSWFLPSFLFIFNLLNQVSANHMCARGMRYPLIPISLWWTATRQERIWSDNELQSTSCSFASSLNGSEVKRKPSSEELQMSAAVSHAVPVPMTGACSISNGMPAASQAGFYAFVT